MQVKDVPNFLRQFKNYFPDSKLNDPNGQAPAVIERHLSGKADNEQLKMEEFMTMLMSIERPADPSINFEESVRKKDEQIKDLRDRLDLLTENNERHVNELNEQSKSEIALKRTIEQLQGQVQSSKSLVLAESGPGPRAIQDLRYTLEMQPVLEVRDKVYNFVDKLLDKAKDLSDERVRLHGHLEAIQTPSAEIASALEDVKRGFQLQSELLQYYEQITPAATAQNLPPADQLSNEDRIEVLLNHNHQSAPQMNRRRPTTKAIESFGPTDRLLEGKRPVSLLRNGSVFAVYSLALWLLGILTTLTLIEYASVSDWSSMEAMSVSSSFVY